MLCSHLHMFGLHFTQAPATTRDFPAAFSEASDTYHDSDLRTKVDAEIDALRGVDLDNVVPFMERYLVPIIIANRLRIALILSSCKAPN
jgi:hypothetical protein